MAVVILDTSFLEDVGGEDPDALSAAETLEESGVPQRISAMSVYELYWGTGYLETPDSEKERVDSILGSKYIYEVTPEIARKAGRIAGELSAKGLPLHDPGDEVIGATGVVHEEPVLTGNTNHFERIPGLEVESY